MGRSIVPWNFFLARESKLATELIVIKTKKDDLKTSLDSGAVRICYLEREIA